MRSVALSGLVSQLLLQPLGAQSPAPLTVIVEGVARSVPAAALRSMPRDTMELRLHDQPTVRYEGVSLAAILKVVGVRTDSLGGPAMATRVVAESSDGYRVVLALADLDPSLGARRVLLADRMNGQLLPANEGPWRLLVGWRSACIAIGASSASNPRCHRTTMSSESRMTRVECRTLRSIP